MQENFSEPPQQTEKQSIFTNEYLEQLAREIAEANSFERLVTVLEKSQGLPGSHGKTHLPETLTQKVSLIAREPDLHLTQLITRTAGLRDKIEQLLAAEKAREIARSTVEDPAEKPNFLKSLGKIFSGKKS